MVDSNCMLAQAFKLGRGFARKMVHKPTINKPYFTHKPQVELDKHIRDYTDHPQRLHPKARIRYNTITQALEPLKYKLHPLIAEDAKVDLNAPLGLTQEIPWTITRTKSENLPVYRRYTHGRTSNYTEICHVQGDIEVAFIQQDFCNELRKVVSNAEVIPRVGKVLVRGLHRDSVVRWLYLLGF